MRIKLCNSCVGQMNKYHNIKSHVLLMEPITPIPNIFSLVAQQERLLANNFSVTNINSVSSSRNNAPGVCAFCGKTGHTENVCFRKVGFLGQDNKTYKNNRNMCTHCGGNGHTVDACYKKHGYPPGYKFYNGKTGQINTIVTVSYTHLTLPTNREV